jgi:hypothetical protein
MIPSFSDNVKATVYTQTYGFESNGVATNVTVAQSGFFTTHSYYLWSSHAFCVGTNSKYGSKGLDASTPPISASTYGDINLTYSGVMTKFSCYMNSYYYATSLGLRIYLFNNTLGFANPIIHMRFLTSGGVYQNQYYDSLGNTHYLTATNVNCGGSWKIFSIEFTDDIGSVRYRYGSSYDINGTSNYDTAIINGFAVDRIRIYTEEQFGGGYTSHAYLDMLNITTDTSYSGGTTTCGINLDGYDKLGIDNTPNTMDLSYPVFQKINYGLNYGYLAYITLCVNPSMYSIDPNPSNYTLTCMGFSLGGADCYDLDGYNYRLIWEANLDLGDRVEGIPSGKNIDCMFTHSSKVGSVAYWQVCIGTTVDTDLDSDGITSFKLWNSGRTVIDYDVGVSFYFDPTTHYSSADSIFTDSLGLHNGVKNATGYVYNIDIPEGIICSYLLSQTSSQYQCKIVVMKNTTIYYRNLTGLTFPSGVRGVLPDTIGKYTFKLYNYHYIYNITAWVTGVSSGYFISSDPTITNPFETYKIVYRYYHLLGLKGCIGVFDNVTKRGSYVYAHSTYDINVNTSSYKLYPSTALTNEYLTLFVNISYKTPCAYAVHYINDNNILENNIYVSPFELGVNKGNPEGYSAIVKGTHVFSGCRVSIFVNGREMFSVKDEQTFTKTFTPPNPDSYNISLRLYQNGSWVTLKYCQFIASNLGENDNGIIPSGWKIDPPFSYFIGIAIIVITTISPLLIIGGVKRDFNLSSIPQFLYLIMAIVGFVISVVLGFFPLWSILLLIVLAVLILTIMWMKGNNTPTG